MKKLFIAVSILLLVIAAGMFLFNQKSTIVQSHRTFSIKLISKQDSIKSNKQTSISYQIIDENGNVLKSFALNHTKKMHFIIIRKDLQDFQHIHPDFNESSSTFTIPVTFPEDGPYRLYADFTPDKSSNTDSLKNIVASRDINVGNLNNYHPKSLAIDTQKTKTAQNFTIDYIFPSLVIKQTDVQYNLHISSNGSPVTDLEPYLGALAHAIIIRENSLDYIHAHAMLANMSMSSESSSNMNSMPEMDMSGGDMPMTQTTHNEVINTGTGPSINLSTYFPTEGVYKIFTQFQENNKVITTDYTVEVKK